MTKIAKQLLAVLILWQFAAGANAALVHADWQSTNDQLITVDTQSGLQWLSFSQTAIGHQQIRDQLATTYSGFRFATTQELLNLFTTYVPGLAPSGFMFGNDDTISSDLQFVMDSLNYNDDNMRFVNTCSHPSGCDPLGLGAGEGLSRNILFTDRSDSSFAVWFGDDADFVDTQALVRVPDPTTGQLFLVGTVIMLIISRAGRSRRTH